MDEKFSLKDHLFNSKSVTRLAKEIHVVYPPFNTESFIDEILSEFPNLALKQRINHIAATLRKYLPEKYPDALEIIIKALPKENDPTLTDNDFGEFIYAPYSEFVAQYGRSNEYIPQSLDALRQITMRFSAEDAIRYFINEFSEKTYTALTHWTYDTHYHVRRLVSEGSRPKLPWSQKVIVYPEKTIPLLERLYTDTTRYVTRSVANHLNDLSKTHPDLVVSILKKWNKEKKQTEAELKYITNHALRSLIKLGHADAFTLLGYTPNTAIKVQDFAITDPVIMNNYLEFSFTLLSNTDQNCIVDYRIDFQNKKGEMKSKKIFKLKKVRLQKHVPVTITKRHKMLAVMTTRTLYPGNHNLSVLVNGSVLTKKIFEVVKET